MGGIRVAMKEFDIANPSDFVWPNHLSQFMSNSLWKCFYVINCYGSYNG